MSINPLTNRGSRKPPQNSPRPAPNPNPRSEQGIHSKTTAEPIQSALLSLHAMSDTNNQDAAGAAAPEQAAAADQDAPMAYIDRLVAAAGVEDAEQDDNEDDEWLEEEYVEDLVESDDEENDGKSDSEDEEMYDSDESDGVDIDMLCAETTVLRVPAQPKQLSAEAKLDLTWRLGKDESYSDWTIEVITSSDNEDADDGTTSCFYHVHKNTLATGSRKSEYFDGIFSSGVGRFQESASSTSTINLPPDMAANFPDFLDYMYAPFSEASCTLNSDNVLQLRSLASYFIVQALTDATRDFIIDDMKCLDRMEKYLKAALERKEEELIGHAVQICAGCIGSVETDSSLLLAMPPAFFLAVAGSIYEAISRIQAGGSSFSHGKRLHVLRLSLSYFQHFGGSVDKQYFRALVQCLSLPVRYSRNSCATGSATALGFLKLIKKYGWERENVALEWWCMAEIERYLSDSRSSHTDADAVNFISSMSGNIPEFVERSFLQRGYTRVRRLKRKYSYYDCKKCNREESRFVLIPCGHMFCSPCAESLEASNCPECGALFSDKLRLQGH